MKGISVVLILAICMGNIFCHMPEAAAATKRITMTRLYNDGNCLPVEEGDTVTIESLEEWNMFAKYSDYPAEGCDMRGVTVELLNDIQVSGFRFSYDEETMRIEVSWCGSLESAYDVNRGKWYYYAHSDVILDGGGTLYPVKCFNGIFEGNGHYICGAFRSLFEKIENGQVRNLNLSHFLVQGDKGGVLCSKFSGKIVNCHGSNIFSVCSDAGGFVGDITKRGKTSVADCSVEGYMSCRSNGGGMIASIDAGAEVMVERCYTSGHIYVPEDGLACVGGILGYTMEGGNVEIRNCVSEVNIAGGVWHGGGIAGENATSLFNCENRGNISSVYERAEVGGLIGVEGVGSFREITVIDRCRNTGKIRSPYVAGGIAGSAREIEIRNTENTGDVCFEDQSDVSKHYSGGIGGIVGRVETMESISGFVSSVGIKNSFCSGNVNGEGYVGGIIGDIQSSLPFNIVCDLGIDNVCVYGEVGAEVEDAAGIILGEVNAPGVELLSVEKVQNVYYREQNTNSVSGDGTELPACMYPVSETQMSGTEEDTYIGQGDFAQTTNLCDALNSWCRAQGESAGMIGWKQGEVFPVLEIDETAKPEKPEKPDLPTFMPTPEPTQRSTQKPTKKPTPNPTIDPTEEPTPKPTEVPTQNPTLKPTPKLTPNPTIDPTEEPTLKPTIIPTEAPTQSPAATASPTVTPLPTVSPPETSAPTASPASAMTAAPPEQPLQVLPPSATLLPAASGKPVVKPTTPAKTDTKKKKMKAPVFSLKKKRTASGKRYVSIRLKRYQGKYVEIWAGRRRKGSKKLIYKKLKIKKNNIRKVRGVFNFQYAKQKGILVFRVRTYSKKGKKRIYSYKSKGKRIRLT